MVSWLSGNAAKHNYGAHVVSEVMGSTPVRGDWSYFFFSALGVTLNFIATLNLMKCQ